jgi:uncharacterized protein
MGLSFEWDETKARSNRRKHGITFAEAASAFEDKLMVTKTDTRDSAYEGRFFSMGESERGRLLAISHTEIGDLIRIISARPATASERRDYEEND